MKIKFSKKSTMLFAVLLSFGALFSALFITGPAPGSKTVADSGVNDIVKGVDAAKMQGSLKASKQEAVSSEIVKRHHEVLLQGADIAVLREQVKKIGGIVTHELPIINGIGVRVNDNQLVLLKKLSKSLKVTDNKAVFTSGSLNNCLVYGSHVAELTDNSIRWDLYNARDMKANIEHMLFKWPEELGHVLAVTLNDKPVYSGGLDPDSGELSIDIKRFAKLKPFEGVTVEVLFADDGVENYQQRDFSIDVDFKENCDRSLVKGYDTQTNEGDSNSYYVNKIGADELHDRGITGTNVTVAVIDSGLWAEHSALSNDTTNNTRIKAAYDAIENIDLAAQSVTDENSHGTHITGIIANSDRAVVDGQMRSYYQGVAPDANLVVVKAFYEDGHSTYLHIL
ncbi:MAG: serine protease AprX, partial [Paraglaciecola sp.]